MKKIMRYCMLLLAVAAVASCKEKKEDNIIIAHKPVIVHRQQTATQKTGDNTSKRIVRWIGADYTVTVTVKADPSLPTATDGTSKYYDNRITLTIDRADGTEFYNRTFTKADFKAYVDDTYYKKGALLAIVFDKVDGNNLKFAASVGSPDKASDEFVPLELTVNNLGATSVEKSVALEEE